MAEYIKNISRSYQSFKADGVTFNIAPGKVIPITESQLSDHSVEFLIAVGRIEVVGKKAAVEDMKKDAAERKAKEEERKLEVRPADSNVIQTVMMAQCAGIKKNGERCGNNVSVPYGEYDEGKDYYCKMHKSQEPVVADPDTDPLPLDID